VSRSKFRVLGGLPARRLLGTEDRPLAGVEVCEASESFAGVPGFSSSSNPGTPAASGS